MKKIFFNLLLFLPFCGQTQPYIEDLWGFRLGQLREVVQKNLGEPFKAAVYTDGYEYDKFLIYNDTSLTIEFEYAPDTAKGAYKIETINLKGTYDKVVFQGLKLGDKEEVVQKLLGKPSYKKQLYSQGERWEYWETNYALEIYKNHLIGIKIKDITEEIYHKYDRSILPKFSKILNTFIDGDNKAIANLLHPEFEAFPENLRFYFAYPMDLEIATDTSKVFLLARSADLGVAEMRKAKVGEIVENLRFEKKKPPVLTYKCAEKFKISEIELIYYLGTYRIRHIRYR